MAEELKAENSVVEEKKSVFCFSHIFIIIGLILMFFALLSHNRQDFSVIEGGSPDQVKNWIGPAGAHFARIVLYFFGVAAFPIIAFVTLCLLRPLIRIQVSRRGYLGSVISVIIGITILFGMYPEPFCFFTDYLGIGSNSIPSSALSGGVIGQKLAAPLYSRSPGLITGVIGGVGCFVVAMVFMISGLVFVWICDWQPIVKNHLEKCRLQALRDNPVDELRDKRLRGQEETIQDLKKKKDEEEAAKLKDGEKIKIDEAVEDEDFDEDEGNESD